MPENCVLGWTNVISLFIAVFPKFKKRILNFNYILYTPEAVPEDEWDGHSFAEITNFKMVSERKLENFLVLNKRTRDGFKEKSN